MFCPNCGTRNIVIKESPNGGELYVAEDCITSQEYYDEIEYYHCNDCLTEFYLSVSDKSFRKEN